jgi:hypothetical protein
VARLSTWRPTVRPICASSPAACTAVVTTSVVLGRPPSRGGSGRGGGGGAGRAAAGFAAGDFADFAFDAFVAGAFAFVALAFVPLAFLAALGFALAVALGRVAAGAAGAAGVRRSAPIRDTRVARRLPRTLGSVDGLAAFFVFFLAVLSAMRKKVARARVVTGYSDAATRSVTAPVRKK